MKKQSMLIVLFLLTFAVLASAQDKKDKKEVKEVTITGELIDVKCYLTGMMGGKGEDHKQCAIDCIKGGLPVGILEDKTEKVFTVVPKKGMDGGNSTLAQFASQKMTLTGTVVEKGGTRLFIYSKAEEVK